MYKFLDIGAKLGRSTLWASWKFGVRSKEGIGIDIREKFLFDAKNKGYNVTIMNALNLGFKDKSFEFSILSELLEHLNSIQEITKVVSEACRVSRDFIYIRNPNFEADFYLRKYDLKFCWADWTGHPMHITSNLLADVFKNVGINNYKIKPVFPIYNTSYKHVVPVDAEANTKAFDPKKHKKNYVTFNSPVYTKIEAYIYLEKGDKDIRCGLLEMLLNKINKNL